MLNHDLMARIIEHMQDVWKIIKTVGKNVAKTGLETVDTPKQKCDNIQDSVVRCGSWLH